jgi:hypothetical protein
VDDFRQQQDQLEKELQRANEELSKEYRSMTAGWGARFGPLVISVRASAEIITISYVLFNIICFVVGVVFTLQDNVLRTLGIALVVGGLFSGGTFMAQWWDHAWQRQNATIDRAFNLGYDDKRYAELQRLAKEVGELYEKLKSLPEPSSENNIGRSSREEHAD